MTVKTFLAAFNIHSALITSQGSAEDALSDPGIKFGPSLEDSVDTVLIRTASEQNAVTTD